MSDTMENRRRELLLKLPLFMGSGRFIPYSIGGILLTEGVVFLADTAQAYWLMDIIGSHQTVSKVGREAFQLWTLKVSDDYSAVVTMQKTSEGSNIVVQQVPYTDFPLKEIVLWAIENEFGTKTVMLPSEY